MDIRVAQLPLKLIIIFYSFSLFTIAHAQVPGEIISSLCRSDDLQTVSYDDSRECAFKVRSSIIRFFDEYEVPLPKQLPSLKYPQKCLYQSYTEEVVNLSYEIDLTGKSHQIRILNSSNDCFNKAARNYIRKLKFDTSLTGYSCVPWSLLFRRHTLTDSGGNKY
jgi:hypothetical protein